MSRLCKNPRRAPSLFKCNFIINKLFTKNPTNTCHATYILFLKTELESQINVFFTRMYLHLRSREYILVTLPTLNAINNMIDFEFWLKNLIMYFEPPK